MNPNDSIRAAAQLLATRAERLCRFFELGAPAVLIEKELVLVREAGARLEVAVADERLRHLLADEESEAAI